ncbi:50S ribosomal protein L4 [Methylovulum psychrotolerans]|jgi:large subunit ribosomal protein L4|uniref:Large ribosomal subunit protein uL4 n=1 Tax=Methylovulum psychrotolerans TaxID=1704499 RepID=A0A1Z4BW27_9GAMM|nr:50S ribosomal protein L4 [Methylovulum psychrotolerans]ASF45517.1 50S ribosomal protein L4 [Methylovulum psychrotolerans]MBT9098465.1 50S ribosomal protein L4 [Methylovulum psychrotolerans]POZ52947.1 50S ribosomal protein L4 [Methylovulum psychrotolerans]
MGLYIPALNEGDSAGQLEVADAVFGQAFNETLVHQLVVRYMAGGRAGTKAQKTRSDVSGGGIKPWRQKGTGRARSGTTRSPIWRTGGVTFAARPRSYEQKLNKKMFRVGIKSILSELLRQERLVVSQDILPGTPKTKELVAKLKTLDAKRVVIIVEQLDVNLALAARNIPYVEVVEAINLSPVLLVSADKVIATPQALKIIEERLS